MHVPHKRPFIEKWKTSFLKRRYSRARRRALVNGAHSLPTTCRYFGADFLVHIDDLIGYEIAINRLEWREIKLMIDACERLKPDIFVDVGANIGVYSCILGRRRLVPRVLALEPDTLSFSRLHTNLELNGLRHIVDARAIAVGACEGTTAFVPGDRENRGLSKIGPVVPGSYNVTVAALDDLLHIRSSTIAVKIDVEGHEIELLAGAERLFDGNAGFAQIEGHGDQRAAEITARMRTLGWDLVDRYGINLRFERSATLPRSPVKSRTEKDLTGNRGPNSTHYTGR